MTQGSVAGGCLMDRSWSRLLRRLRWVAPALSCFVAGGVAVAQDFPEAPIPASPEDLREGRVQISDGGPGPVAPAPHWQTPPTGGYPMPPLAPGPQGAPLILPPGMTHPYCPPGQEFVGGELPYNMSTWAKPSRPRDLWVPNMIGDALGSFGTATISAQNAALDQKDQLNPSLPLQPEQVNSVFDLPISSRIPKIAENNSPIPRDRVYFAYNHFHSAYDFQSSVTGRVFVPADPTDPTSVDTLETRTQNTGRNYHQNRYTLGLEKTFFNDDFSVEFRLPLVGLTDYQATSVVDPTQIAVQSATNDPVGDFQINLKQVLLDFYGPKLSGVMTWGVGFTFPTGDGATTQIYDARFQVDDSAYHFSPFLGFVLTNPNCWFVQGFFQFDLTNDDIEIFDSVTGDAGSYKSPHLAHIDLGVGYWIVHNPHRRFIQGIAPIFEFHYSSRIRSLDPYTFASNNAAGNVTSLVTIDTLGTNRDVYNLTAGLHTAVTSWMNFRTAGVFPYKSEPNRDFDAEFVFQLDFTR